MLNKKVMLLKLAAGVNIPPELRTIPSGNPDGKIIMNEPLSSKTTSDKIESKDVAENLRQTSVALKRPNVEMEQVNTILKNPIEKLDRENFELDVEQSPDIDTTYGTSQRSVGKAREEMFKDVEKIFKNIGGK